MFREWLSQVSGASNAEEEYLELMKRLNYVKAGRHFTRDEMNER
jgi:hypothetical protein